MNVQLPLHRRVRVWYGIRAAPADEPRAAVRVPLFAAEADMAALASRLREAPVDRRLTSRL